MEEPDIDHELVDHFQTRMLEWGDENIRQFPWRESDRGFYEVFIAEFFLARTRSNVVERIYPGFLDCFPTLDSLRDAPRTDLIEVIRPMGLQNRRADAIQELVDQVDGGLPRDEEDLKELPRVGPYVANATLCFAEREPLPILDTNVNRVHQRFFGDMWPSHEEGRWKFLQATLPTDRPRDFNLTLLDFGALVCSAQSPDCQNCPLADSCAYFDSLEE